MKIACLSDVHANLPALQAMVSHARRRGADRIFCAGDIVGYGPFPNEVIRFLIQENIDCISGNYDAKILRVLRNPLRFQSGMKKFKWEVLDWTARQLNIVSRRYLAGLPPEFKVDLNGTIQCLMVHGSPRSHNETLYPSLTLPAWREIMHGPAPDILLCGHTHIPFVQRFQKTLLVNAGSAGQPVDGDPRGSYAMIHLRNGLRPRALIHRFEYPQKDLLSAIRRSSLPQRLIENFQQGRKEREVP